MHEYYFKIKKDDIEFEFSTTDKFTFEQQLSDWINGVVRGEYIAPPAQADDTSIEEQTQLTTNDIKENEKPERSGFINVKNLISINKITTPNFKTNHHEQELAVNQDFEKTLEESMQNPKIEVKEKNSTYPDFSNYLHSYNPQSALDNLIVTAKYILNIENQERFTIKQVNAKLVPATGTPIDHGVIEDSIQQNLIKLVPDLTGMSDFTEYTLTDDGEHYFID